MAVNFKSENLAKHKDLSDSIKSNLNVEGHSIKEKESHGSYYSNLPDGVEKKHVEEIAKYNSKYITAAHVAVGELAAEVFLKDKSDTPVEAEIGIFGKQDTLNITVDRSKTYQNQFGESEADKQITKHLVMKTTVNSQGMKGYGLKSVRDHMSEEFQGLFKK